MNFYFNIYILNKNKFLKMANIKRFEEFNENTRNREVLGIDRMPSNVRSRQDQEFYDYYTRQKFTGKSKYELNREVWKLAQREDEIGTLAQFILQIERESIASDDSILGTLDDKRKTLEDLIEKVPMEGEG
jgi:hypothetical protein